MLWVSFLICKMDNNSIFFIKLFWVFFFPFKGKNFIFEELHTERFQRQSCKKAKMYPSFVLEIKKDITIFFFFKIMVLGSLAPVSKMNKKGKKKAFTTYFRFLWFGFSACGINISSFNFYYQNSKKTTRRKYLIYSYKYIAKLQCLGSSLEVLWISPGIG